MAMTNSPDPTGIAHRPLGVVLKKDLTGKLVTEAGVLYTITQYDPNDPWCYITPIGGGEPLRASAGWARQRVRWFEKDQSLVGKWFELADEDGPVYWKCVDRRKGYFTLEDPKDGHQVSFHVDFLYDPFGGCDWQPLDAPPAVAA